MTSNSSSIPTLPSAVLFDAYRTLFGVYSVGQLAEEFFPGHGLAMSVLWRDKQIEYTRLVTIRLYKTHLQAYALGEQAAGFTVEQIVFVSSNAWDALGASWHGYQALWVNR